jgi:hypothetical protein
MYIATMVARDRPSAHSGQLLRRQEVDGQEIGRRRSQADEGTAAAERQIDVADEELNVFAAAHGFVGQDGLERDGQTQRLCERGRHDHQRQAISRLRGKCLCRIPGHGRVVFDLEEPIPIDRVDQAVAGALGKEVHGDLALEEALHFRAEREDVVGADALRRRGEQAIVEQSRIARRHRDARAGGKQHGKKHDCPMFHLAPSFPGAGGSFPADPF